MDNTHMNGTLIDHVADQIRLRIIEGFFKPGQHLSEKSLQENLTVSRNSLREAFRLLTKEGLLNYEPNRGVFVATPDLATILDVYRIRRYIECQALKDAQPFHPSVKKMRMAVDDALQFRKMDEWLKVGSADIRFHSAIVGLADSPRLAAFFDQITAQLRLVFGLLDDPHYLHAAYVDQNDAITKNMETGEVAKAAHLLEKYLDQSERFILNAYMQYQK